MSVLPLVSECDFAGYCAMKIRKIQSGLSLIEVLIALTIGMFLVMGVIYFYTAAKQTYRVDEALARLQENARLAVELLSRDVRMAGYWGCGTGALNGGEQYLPPATGSCKPAANQLVNTLNNASEFNFGRYVEGADAPANCGTGALNLCPNVKSGTDVIELRGIDTLCSGSSGSATTKIVAHPGGNPPGSADLKVNDASCISDGDILLASDCTTAVVFQATNVNAGKNVVHNMGTGVPGNFSKCFGKSYAGADLYKVYFRNYYVGTLTSTGGATSTGLSALFMANRSNRAGSNSAGFVFDELVPGVLDMQITYGVDTNSDSFVDGYYTASQVDGTGLLGGTGSPGPHWGRVLTVQFDLLLVSLEDNVAAAPVAYRYPASATTDTTATDRRLYYPLMFSVGIRNRLQ